MTNMHHGLHRLKLVACLLALGLTLTACEQSTPNAPANNAPTNEWDNMKWEQSTWG